MVLLRIDGEKWEARDTLRIHARRNSCWKLFKKVLTLTSLFSKSLNIHVGEIFLLCVFGRMWISVDDSEKLHCISIVFKGKSLIIHFWDCQKINEHLTTLIKVGAIITTLQMFCIYLIFHVFILIDFKNIGISKYLAHLHYIFKVINSHWLIMSCRIFRVVTRSPASWFLNFHSECARAHVNETK